MTINNKSYETVYFSIDGMSCHSCVNKIKSVIKDKSVKTVIDLLSGKAAVTYDPSGIDKGDLAAAVKEAGYGIREIDRDSYDKTESAGLKSVFLSSPFPYIKGITASLCLIGFYIGLLTLVSGWYFATVQFEEYLVWILLLAAGLGMQVFLYSILKIHRKRAELKGAGKSIAASGGISTFGMAACCSHYLITVLPALGVPFLSTAIASLEKYQTEFFALGVISNIIGILFMLNLMKKNNMILNKKNN